MVNKLDSAGSSGSSLSDWAAGGGETPILLSDQLLFSRNGTTTDREDGHSEIGTTDSEEHIVVSSDSSESNPAVSASASKMKKPQQKLLKTPDAKR